MKGTCQILRKIGCIPGKLMKKAEMVFKVILWKSHLEQKMISSLWGEGWQFFSEKAHSLQNEFAE